MIKRFLLHMVFVEWNAVGGSPWYVYLYLFISFTCMNIFPNALCSIQEKKRTQIKLKTVKLDLFAYITCTHIHILKHTHTPSNIIFQFFIFASSLINNIILISRRLKSKLPTATKHTRTKEEEEEKEIKSLECKPLCDMCFWLLLRKLDCAFEKRRWMTKNIYSKKTEKNTRIFWKEKTKIMQIYLIWFAKQ